MYHFLIAFLNKVFRKHCAYEYPKYSVTLILIDPKGHVDNVSKITSYCVVTSYGQIKRGYIRGLLTNVIQKCIVSLK